jgi:ubiquinone/menaquinone biosynthesis C-methylase UbiE
MTTRSPAPFNHTGTRLNYDRMSRWYDLFAGSEQRCSAAAIDLLDIHPGEHVLEVGCGTGHALELLARAGAVVTGTDLSPGMLSRSQRITRRRHPARARLCQSDALELPFTKAAFEALFSSFFLELLPDREIALALEEFRRVLRPDGKLALVSLVHAPTRMVQLYEWFHLRWPGVVDCRPIELLPLLERHGYRIVESRQLSMWGLPVGLAVAWRT